MDFNIGDVIYKKKFYGDKLLPDKRNSYIIMYLYTVSYPGCNNLLFATLDNNKEFEKWMEITFMQKDSIRVYFVVVIFNILGYI